MDFGFEILAIGALFAVVAIALACGLQTFRAGMQWAQRRLEG